MAGRRCAWRAACACGAGLLASIGCTALPFVDRMTRSTRSPFRTRQGAYAELLHKGNSILSGKNKWLGGVEGLDKNIYCIPCNKNSVLQISTDTGEISTFGSTAEGRFKWSRGVMANGKIYGIPAAAESVLKIVPSSKEVVAVGSVPTGTWKWHGAAVAPDGSIYCIPANADGVLRIDPKSDQIELVGDSFPGRWKWYGGILAGDGCIYGIPYCAASVLKIDPATGQVSTIGELPDGRWKWHGGSLGTDGAIYGIPAHAESVLTIRPETGEVKCIGGPIFGKYKWLGAVLGCDGCLYGIPYNAPKILKISPFNEDVDLVDVPIKGPNMWQGGVRGNDGALYFIPRQAKQVLRVSSDGQSIAAVPGEELHGWNKFQGAVLARDGCIYGVPFIHRVGLALLKEARADLLGKGFDATIERLRCLCQRSQLSPEALVASAMEFKVTNRFLSDLEQAITSPSGAARLPSCFLERDLDRGRTQCRFLLNTDGGSEAPVLTGQDLTFWEASLPPPRVPSDPLTPGLSLEPPGDPKEKSKAKSQLKSFARKSQKVLSKVKTPVVLSMRSSGKSAKHEAPAQSLSDSERKEKSHHRSSSVPSHRGYQRCGAAAAASAWDVPMIPSPSAKTTARQWMPSLRSGRKQSPNGRSF